MPEIIDAGSIQLDTQAFDPEGSGYDYVSAKGAGMGPDETGHWPSRNPVTGQILKGKTHETFYKTEKGESEVGYAIQKGQDGKYYSQKANIVDAGSIQLDNIAEEHGDILSWRKAPEPSVWDRIKSVFPDDSAAQSAKAVNSLNYSQMLNISPSTAYEFHDEISDQLKNKTEGEKIVTKKQGGLAAFMSGRESSISGMLESQKVPKPFESVSQSERWIQGMTTMAYDLPYFVAGGAIGGTGGPISSMAGAFGFTAGLRQMLVDRYTKGEVKDAADLFDRIGSAAKETIKGEVVGGFTGGARFMAPAAFAKLAPGVAPPAGWTLMSELAAMTTAGKLVEGQLPTARDFVDNAAILLTMHAGVRGYETVQSRIPEVRQKLQQIFIETGAHPKEVLNRVASEAAVDPKEDVTDVLNRVTEEIKATAPVEPAEKPTEQTGKVSPKGEIAPPEASSQGKTYYWGGKSIDPSRGVFLSENPEYAGKFASQTEGTVHEVNLLGEPKIYPEPMGWQEYQNIWRKDQMFSGYDAVRVIEPNGQGESLAIINPKIISESSKPPAPLRSQSVATDKVNIRQAKSGGSLSTSTKNAVTDAEREARGLPPIESPAGGKRSENWREEVQAKVDSGEIDPRREAEKINNLVEQGERPSISQDIEHALLYDRKRLQNEQKAVEGEIEKNPAPELQQRLSEIDDALDANYRATKATSTEWGRVGLEKQQMMNGDYSLAAMIRRAKDDGVEVTPELREKYRKISKKMEKAEKTVNDIVEQTEAGNIEKTVKQLKNEENLSQRKQKREVKTEALDVEFDSLVKKFNQTIGGQLNVGIDPAGVKILVDLARNRIQKGIVKAEDIVDSIHTALVNAGLEYSKRDIRDAISQYGIIKEMSKEEVAVALREAKRQMQLISAFEDAKKGVPPLKSGLKRDAQSDLVREMTREVHTAMREAGITAKSPEDQWKSDLDKVKKRLQNSIADVTKQIETGKREPKSKGIEYDAEAKSLKEHAEFLKMVRDALEEEPATFAPEKPGEMPKEKNRQQTPEQKVSAALKAAERAAGEYARRVAEGDLAPKKKERTTLETPELIDARTRKDEWKALVTELKDAAKEKRPADEVALERFRKLKERQIAEYETRIKGGNFLPKEKKTMPPLGEAELKAQFDLDQVKKEYNRAKMEDYLATRGVYRKFADGVIESLNLIKAIKSAYDVSAPGRQAVFAILSHPAKGFKNIPDMFRALKSEEAVFRISSEIAARENSKNGLYKDAGIDFTASDSMSGGKVEEYYRSRWAEMIPGIPASNRAFTAFLNLVRADLFDVMYKNNFADRPATGIERQAIGRYVNAATGRGTIKGMEQALSGLGTFLWAPKLVVSRFQMALGSEIWMPGGARTAATRWAVAKEYARILGSLSIVYGVSDLLGFEVGLSPTSSNFGKIKVGNTWIDPLGGLAQVTVFMARMVTGEKTNQRGVAKPTRGDNVPYGGATTWSVISDFLRTKLTPALGMGVNLMQGKNIIGEKMGITDIPGEVLYPLAFKDIYDAMREEGIPTGAALGTLGMFGVGIQTHETKGASK